MNQQEDILLAALNASSEFSFIVDRDLKIVLFNNAAQHGIHALTQMNVAIGESILDYSYTASKELIKERITKALKGETIEVELEVKTPQQVPAWFLIRYVPVKDRAENIFAVSLNLSDITLRKEAELLLKQREVLPLDIVAGSLGHQVDGSKKLQLPSTTGKTLISVDDVMYCKADSNYTIFFLRNNKKIVVSQTLKCYEKLLSQHSFFRIHNSYLINLNNVYQYSNSDGGQVVMMGGIALPVSRKKREIFLKLFLKIKSN